MPSVHLHHSGAAADVMSKQSKKTRMHSSRMRTARLLTVSYSARGAQPLLDADPRMHLTFSNCQNKQRATNYGANYLD